MNARIALLIIAGVFHAAVRGQLPVPCPDPQSMGMAHSGVMLANTWSGLSNPAGLPGIRTIRFGISYENSFMVPGAGTEALACIIPTRTGNYGISLVSFGNSGFLTGQASLSFGKTFGDKFRAGIGLHYLYIHQQEGYGNLFALVPSAGIQVLPNKKLVLGLHVLNPVHQQYHPEGFAGIPVVITGGAAYSFGDEVTWYGGMHQSSGEKLQVFSGFEISLQKALQIRFGVHSGNYPELAFGLGYKSPHLTMDLAVIRHPVLGFLPAFGISYAF